MRDGRLKHHKAQEAGKWVPSEESMQAFENIKALGRQEIGEGRADSPISKFIKLFVDEVEKASQV